MPLSRWAVAAATVLTSVSALAAAPAASAATHPGQVTLGHGVTMWRQSFTSSNGHPERAVLTHVDLGLRNVTFTVASPQQAVGATRQPLQDLANADHAVAGINADFFDLRTSTAVPRGAIIRGGHVAKTPRPHWLANFYIRPDGHAAIGEIPFVGSVTRSAQPKRRASSYRVFSTNTLADAAKGRITLVDSDLVAIPLGRNCTAALGTTQSGVRRVVAVETGARSLTRRTASSWALIACGGNGADWLTRQVRAHDVLTWSLTYPNGRPRTAVTGGRVLVSGGRAFNDWNGQALRGLNPMTFACVSRSGLSVLLGVIDGRTWSSYGVTYGELTNYLLRLGCYSGMTLDGGGSTTMVGRLPGHTTTSLLNLPAMYSGSGIVVQRPLADALLVRSP